MLELTDEVKPEKSNKGSLRVCTAGIQCPRLGINCPAASEKETKGEVLAKSRVRDGRMFVLCECAYDGVCFQRKFLQ